MPNGRPVIGRDWSGYERSLPRPFALHPEGIGKPERLKGDLSGYYSRRISDEHRLVYKPEGDTLLIIQCRYHY